LIIICIWVLKILKVVSVRKKPSEVEGEGSFSSRTGSSLVIHHKALTTCEMIGYAGDADCKRGA
jgi:hypothetical protein